MNQFVKTIFKFYRLNQKLLLGGAAIAVLLLIVMTGSFVFNKIRSTQTSQQITEIQVTPSPETNTELNSLSAPTSTMAAKIATSGAMTATPSVKVASPIPTPVPTPRPTAQIIPKVTATPSAKPISSTPSATPKASVKPTPAASPTPKAVIASPSAKPTVAPTPTPTIKPSIAPAPTPQPVVQNETKGGISLGTYTVQKGDTLFDIAEKQLGNGSKYVELAKLNNLKSAHHIEVGQVLKLSSTDKAIEQKPVSGETKVTDTVTGDTKVQPQAAHGSYTIQKGDTLWSIAEKQLGNAYRWTEIYNLNKKVIGGNPGLIYPNTALQLPTHK